MFAPIIRCDPFARADGLGALRNRYATDVGDGSKPEKLIASICCPLFIQ